MRKEISFIHKTSLFRRKKLKEKNCVFKCDIQHFQVFSELLLNKLKTSGLWQAH